MFYIWFCFLGDLCLTEPSVLDPIRTIGTIFYFWAAFLRWLFRFLVYPLRPWLEYHNAINESMKLVNVLYISFSYVIVSLNLTSNPQFGKGISWTYKWPTLFQVDQWYLRLQVRRFGCTYNKQNYTVYLEPNKVEITVV